MRKRQRALKLFAVAVAKQTAADLCGVSLRTINEWCAQGILPLHRIGNRHRVLICDLVAAVRMHRVKKG
jgi:excisionase family DNA binding protein